MARPVESQSVFSLKDNLSFWIFQNTIGHLAPRVAADRNLAPFDTAAILARSFSVQFTGAAGGLKRCTPIYSPSAAFGSVPTVRPIFMLRTVCPRELPTMHKIHLKWRLQCFGWLVFFSKYHFYRAEYSVYQIYWWRISSVRVLDQVLRREYRNEIRCIVPGWPYSQRALALFLKHVI